MIVTTTPGVEGHPIQEYKGVVFGEVIAGVNFVKDMMAGFSNFFGGPRQGVPTPWWRWTWTMKCWAATMACLWSAHPAPPWSSRKAE